MERSAGIAIIYEKKILMTHAKNSPWGRSWMPPKGKIEEGEAQKNAACRETEEECGIKVHEEKLGRMHTIPYEKQKTGKKYKEVYIFECKIGDLSEVGIPPLVRGEIPKYMLQEEEISDARFMGYEECKSKSLPRYLPMIEEIFNSLFKEK